MVGVSPDDAETTRRFCDELGLLQTMILDPDGELATRYGAKRLGGWLPNKRVTVVIGRDGKVLRVHHAELALGQHLQAIAEALDGV